MGLKPLREFVCDKCGALIEKVEDGWLEWFDDYKKPAHGFRIVHAGGDCYYLDTPEVSDNHLIYFMGTDGLSYLLSLLSRKNGVNVAELVEVIRRLHVPFYEEARQYLDRAIGDGMISDKNEFRRTDLEAILAEYGEERRL